MVRRLHEPVLEEILQRRLRGHWRKLLHFRAFSGREEEITDTATIKPRLDLRLDVRSFGKLPGRSHWWLQLLNHVRFQRLGLREEEIESSDDRCPEGDVGERPHAAAGSDLTARGTGGTPDTKCEGARVDEDAGGRKSRSGEKPTIDVDHDGVARSDADVVRLVKRAPRARTDPDDVEARELDRLGG